MTSNSEPPHEGDASESSSEEEPSLRRRSPSRQRQDRSETQESPPQRQTGAADRPEQPQQQRLPIERAQPVARDGSAARGRGTRERGSGDAGLKVIALAAFVFGVALHGCVAASILEDEGDSGAASGQEVEVEPRSTQAPVIASTQIPEEPEDTPEPTALPDRTSCEEIAGTEYRSASEREFFLENCTAGLLPGGAPRDGPESG